MQAETLGDKRIVVAIDSWEADSAYPAGHYVRTLGTIGDRETETEVRAAHRSPETLPSTSMLAGVGRVCRQNSGGCSSCDKLTC